jgi:hypothetical protein
MQGSTDATPPPRHLVAVWNPSYTDDAMDAHLRVLLRWAEEARGQRADAEEEVYVWWGRVASRNRQAPLRHAAEVLALQEQIDAGVPTHLYLTDYRSLYVAELGEVTAEDVLAEDAGHAPAYYAELRVDFWFRLWDVRRLVADDTLEVVEALKRLRNLGYHDRPVSLYGGMVDLPLLVTEDPPAGWFEDAELLTGGALWAERDAELRSEVPRMMRELRDNLFGRRLWAALDPTTRTFLSVGETIFRSRRDDPGFDFSGVVVEYAKAVETEANALVFGGMRRAVRQARARDERVRVDGSAVDPAGTVRRQTLGAIARMLVEDETARKWVRLAFPREREWALGQLPQVLDRLAEVRNPAAHSGVVGREQAEEVRAVVLGIGREGVVGRMGGCG